MAAKAMSTLATVIDTSNLRDIVPVASAESVALQRSPSWSGLTPSQLDQIVRDSISELQVLSRKGQAEIRERLLPALTEVKRRFNEGEIVAGCNGIEDYLQSIGLNPNTVRSWEFRIRQKELKELGAYSPRLVVGYHAIRYCLGIGEDRSLKPS